MVNDYFNNHSLHTYRVIKEVKTMDEKTQEKIEGKATEEGKTEKAVQGEDSSADGKKSKAEELAEKEELIKKEEELFEREAVLKAQRKLGGDSEAGQTPVKKEETDKEYSDRVDQDIREGKYNG